MVALTWMKATGAEYAAVETGDGRLHASGVAIGAKPLPYRLDYTLACWDGYATRQLSVRVAGAGWTRGLELNRDADGTWQVAAVADGEAGDAGDGGDAGLPPPGCDAAALAGAVDCDLGLSPLTNTMPVLRHGLLTWGDPVDLLVAWVSVPDLCVRPCAQRYEFTGFPAGGKDRGAIVTYSSGSFSADITFDAAGLVVDYPGLAVRA